MAQEGREGGKKVSKLCGQILPMDCDCFYKENLIRIQPCPVICILSMAVIRVDLITAEETTWSFIENVF